MLAGLITFYWYRIINKRSSPVLVFDAAGLGLFAVAGASKALAYHAGPVAATLLGMLTGVGGGMARDVLVSEIPTVLRTELYAVAALVGSAVVVIGHTLHFPPSASGVAGAVLCFALRYAAMGRWQFPVANWAAKRSSPETGIDQDHDLRRLSMSSTVIVCGNMFDGWSENLSGPAEILVEGNRITDIGRSLNRPPGAHVIDLSDRTVTPGFIDTHVHLTMDAANLAQQTLESSATKALKGLSLAREYMSYGFTTLRDLGTADPEWPTVDLRNALDAGVVEGPRLIVAAHILSASAGHGDLRGFYNPRWDIRVSAIADDVGRIKALVRREHTFGSDWIKTTNTGGYFSAGDDPARVTWFDDEMEILTSTARQLGMPVAVHTGAANGCKQAIRFGVRSLEHAYLIDSEGVQMAIQAGSYVVPTMQMTQEDLQQLRAGTLPCQAVWKFRRDNESILASQKLLAASQAKIAYGTDCGMFPFSHGILEFQAMVKAGLSPVRALKAAMSIAAELLRRNDLGVLAPGKLADIVAMPGDPFADISATARVDFVMKDGNVFRDSSGRSEGPGNREWKPERRTT